VALDLACPCVVCGIDPGLDGGIAFILPDGSAVAEPAPTRRPDGSLARREFDRDAMVRALGRCRPALAAIERVHIHPGDGKPAATRFMVGYGLWLGILAALGVEVVEVPPGDWQRQVLGRIPAGESKTYAAAFCGRAFPGVSLLATPRSRTFHDGMSDALCLAEYARRLALGNPKYRRQVAAEAGR
jgi:hypothetical protein